MLQLDDIADAQRLVSIDIETTGYPAATPAEAAKMPKGMRLPGLIIEIGCIELLRDGDSWTKGETWERRLNPDAPVNKASIAIHGIHPNSLRQSPRFNQIVEEFQAFLGDGPLLAHSAQNEINFLNYEFHRAKLATWEEWPFGEDRFICTQKMSHSFFPGASGSLDALCDRLWVDRSNRFEHHGALLDADLTADAFIKMAGGFVQDETRHADF
ncbi:MAG TPA: exonuclease domain-containing protein [Patescibacteria group bacterium]|nr:exonuclease domain-containing protein [Patescibacteria group bacterium]